MYKGKEHGKTENMELVKGKGAGKRKTTRKWYKGKTQGQGKEKGKGQGKGKQKGRA